MKGQPYDEMKTGKLESLADHKFERHAEVREARRGNGAEHKTDTQLDDLMRDILADIREIENVLADRGAL